MSSEIKTTRRTTLKRIPKRGNFDRETIYKILDEAFICHVGFVVDGKPFVIPTSFARTGDNLMIHGSSASRMMRNLSEGIEVCVTVTLIDGLVLARSAFHHSMNYRSVVIFGTARLIENEREKIDETLIIPMDNEVESLNLAVSCGIILFEAKRQFKL